MRPGIQRVMETPPTSSAEAGTSWPRHQPSFTAPPHSVRPPATKRPLTISTAAIGACRAAGCAFGWENSLNRITLRVGISGSATFTLVRAANCDS